ncbi:MAG: aconitase/3-isopropylmalate dehydratase large subunit family protein [Candidatus Eisenbacteria bacterium]
MTIIEKILSRGAGKEVKANERVWSDVDFAVIRDFGGPNVVLEYEKHFGDRSVWDPSRVALTFDYQAPAKVSEVANNQRICRDFARKQGIQKVFDVNTGIGQHVLLEHGLIHPGSIVVGMDSHMNLLGAAGSFATGVGTTDMVAAWHSGRLWFRVPETIKVSFKGKYDSPTSAKDLTLHFLAQIGPDKPNYRALEFYGDVIEHFHLHDAVTLASMVTEINGKIGFVPTNAEILAFLKSRTGASPEAVSADSDAAYCEATEIDVTGLPPQVACPHSPTNVRPVSEVKGTKIDFAFVGSCTNGRYEDIAVAAAVLKAGRKVHPSVQLIIVPATMEVARKCLMAGFYETFFEAGAIVTNPGCSLCTTGHHGVLGKGDVLISSSNRNFLAKLGKGSQVYLASPATVAASAVKGEIADPCEFLR